MEHLRPEATKHFRTIRDPTLQSINGPDIYYRHGFGELLNCSVYLDQGHLTFKSLLISSPQSRIWARDVNFDNLPARLSKNVARRRRPVSNLRFMFQSEYPRYRLAFLSEQSDGLPSQISRYAIRFEPLLRCVAGAQNVPDGHIPGH